MQPGDTISNENLIHINRSINSETKLAKEGMSREKMVDGWL